ncbi:hypothetical protein ANAEL_02485 [Anaerolineales bacterium]|nr:hypothetical protein ANAEL_02485 [Anaerolineales bacterium]
MDYLELEKALTELGNRLPPESHLTLIGGSALLLLGSPRLTMDIDFVGDDLKPSELHRQVIQIARELKIQMEPVPLDRFIPLSQGNEKRVIHIAQFGNLSIEIADPYSIALSKVDRGLDSDFEDLVFLIQTSHISLKELESIVQNAVSKAGKFDLHPDILAHLQELKSRLK